jgi:hypothetical protein
MSSFMKASCNFPLCLTFPMFHVEHSCCRKPAPENCVISPALLNV